MIAWPIVIVTLLLIACFSAMGCYALRDFTYSRLEEICQQRGKPERFSQIMKQQEAALLALELLLSLSTLAVAAALCMGIGWPQAQLAAENKSVLWLFVGEYVLFAIAVLLAADILPWTLARVASEPFLYRWWPAVRGVQVLFRPILSGARWLDRAAHRLVGRGEPEEDDKAVINDEIRTVVDEGQREGHLEQNARTMIHRVMEIQNEDVAAVMTPRTNMSCIHVECSVEEARQKLVESGHSRVPVIGDSTDEIIGLLYAKDLLRAMEPVSNPPRIPILRDIVREPRYISETTGITPLLEMMQRERFQMAIVTDEYGGVAGLVTMEDILEEIVGEIVDEYDHLEEQSSVTELAAGVTEVDGQVHTDDLNQKFHYGFPEDGEYETIGGFVFSQLGRVPAPGETLVWNGLRITVIDADKRKINRLRIEPVEAPSEAAPL